MSNQTHLQAKCVAKNRANTKLHRHVIGCINALHSGNWAGKRILTVTGKLLAKVAAELPAGENTTRDNVSVRVSPSGLLIVNVQCREEYTERGEVRSLYAEAHYYFARTVGDGLLGDLLEFDRARFPVDYNEYLVRNLITEKKRLEQELSSVTAKLEGFENIHV